jgi:beta-lactamase superfamily II metal-dependent hydrolase
MPSPIKPEDLLVHIVNVGFGDNIIIEFPVDEQTGKRGYAIVDCRNSTKTINYLDKRIPEADRSSLEFICATHPHGDHISGINTLLKHEKYSPKEFWDSGFRHKSATYRKMLVTLVEKNIELHRVSSGMERCYGKVSITALSPSVMLRNRYGTYGVDMNNSSIVLRIEHHMDDVILTKSQEYVGNKSEEAEREAGKSVIILAGDAEFDSWSHIAQEFPCIHRASEHKPLVKKMVNYLSCSVVKVAHHGSMHSSPLDIYEKMHPKLAIISTKQEEGSRDVDGKTLKRNLFPHDTAIQALKEAESDILTTDGSYEKEQGDTTNEKPGTIVVVIPPGGKPRWKKYNDTSDEKDIPKIGTQI